MFTHVAGLNEVVLYFYLCRTHPVRGRTCTRWTRRLRRRAARYQHKTFIVCRDRHNSWTCSPGPPENWLQVYQLLLVARPVVYLFFTLELTPFLPITMLNIIVPLPTKNRIIVTILCLIFTTIFKNKTCYSTNLMSV